MRIRFTVELFDKTEMFSGVTSVPKDDPSLRYIVAELRVHVNQLYENRHFRVPDSGMIRFTYKGKSLLITY